MKRKQIKSSKDVIHRLRGVRDALRVCAEMQRDGMKLEGLGLMLYSVHGATLEECARWLEAQDATTGKDAHI